WGRLTPGSKAPLRTSPISLLLREHATHWGLASQDPGLLSSEAAAFRDALKKRGASFFNELVNATGLLPAFVERGLAELAGAADAVGRLRAVRKMEKIDELVVLSAADPLNLVGILTPEARVAAIHRNRLLYRDGLPIAALEGGQLRRLADSNLEDQTLKTLLA